MHRFVKAAVCLPSVLLAREAKAGELEESLFKTLDRNNQRVSSLEQNFKDRQAVLRPQIEQFNKDFAKYDPRMNPVITRTLEAVAEGKLTTPVKAAQALLTKGLGAEVSVLLKAQRVELPLKIYNDFYGRRDKTVYYMAFQEKPELDTRRRALEIESTRLRQINEQLSYDRTYRQLLIKDGKQSGILPPNYQEGVAASSIPKLWEISRGRDPNSFNEYANFGERPAKKDCQEKLSGVAARNCDGQSSEKQAADSYDETWTMTNMNTNVQGNIIATPGDNACDIRNNSRADDWHRKFVSQLERGNCRISYAGEGAEKSFIYQASCSTGALANGWQSLGGGGSPAGYVETVQIGRYGDQIFVKKSNPWVQSQIFFRRCAKK